MKTLFAFLLLALPASADLFAVVSGTNVIDVVQYDPQRPPKVRPGMTNVPCAYYVQPGWSYVAPNFLLPDGSAVPQAKLDVQARLDLISGTISDLRLALNNWDTLTVAQQKAVLKRCVQILLAMLVEARVDLTLPDQ